MDISISDDKLLEQLCGGGMWLIFWKYLSDTVFLNFPLKSAIVWILVWIVQKISSVIYRGMKSRYKLSHFTVEFRPYPKVIKA
jgi:hypothetical protein